MTSSNESNNESSKFAPLQVPYTIMVYGLTPYICEYFTCEYFNTTVPSNCEFKNEKNEKKKKKRQIREI